MAMEKGTLIQNHKFNGIYDEKGVYTYLNLELKDDKTFIYKYQDYCFILKSYKLFGRTLEIG